MLCRRVYSRSSILLSRSFSSIPVESWPKSSSEKSIPHEGHKADFEIKNLIRNNEEWAGSLDSDFLENLSQGQKPEYLWIGCADSRVPAETVLGLEAGQVFVHRNVGNIVCNVDMNVHSVLHYAVKVLKVRHILICGHYECGAVKASMQKTDHGPLDGWLRNIRDIYRLHQAELSEIQDEEQRYRKLVELNISEQCFNVFKTPAVQTARAENLKNFGEPIPRVHPMIFDPATGLVKKIYVDWDGLNSAMTEIFQFQDEATYPKTDKDHEKDSVCVQNMARTGYGEWAMHGPFFMSQRKN